MWSMIRNAIGSPFGWVPELSEEEDERMSMSYSSQEDVLDEYDRTNVPGEYEPTIKDVLVVKAMLKKALRLPLEIVDSIIDHAEYWPHTSSYVRYQPNLMVSGRSYGEHDISENEFLIRTPPLGFPGWPPQMQAPEAAPTSTPDNPPEGPVIGDTPCHVSRRPADPRLPSQPLPPDVFEPSIGAPDSLLARPCRKIVFTVRSRDQGWGGDYSDHGTYKGSWTWFEAGLERWCQPGTREDGNQETAQPPSFDLKDLCVVYPEVVTGRGDDRDFNHPLLPVENLKIQCNELATRLIKEHRVVWKHTDNVDPKDEEGTAKLAESGRGKETGDGKFVNEMQIGDMVTVWAKARFPGWRNEIESVKVDVYWVV